MYSPNRRPRRIVSVVMNVSLGSAVLVLGGCAPNLARQATQRALPARDATLEHWKPRRVGPEPAVAVAAARSALLARGCDRLAVEIAPDGRSASVVAMHADRAADGVGSAVFLTADGYLLTAAHCVASEPIRVMLLERSDGSIRGTTYPGRVVERGASDWAIVHADGASIDPARLAEWADWPECRADAEVLGAGLGAGSTPVVGGRITGGSTALADGADGPAATFVVDAPMMPGDSGGPVYVWLPASDSQGELKLVGICARAGVFQNAGSFSTDVIRPDPALVQRIIENDRRTRSR